MRPFRLYGARQLSVLQREAARVVGGWAGDWLADAVPDATVPTTVAPVTVPMPTGPWLSLRSARGAAYVARHAGHVEAALFGPVAHGQPSALAAEVADAALADLLRRCLEADEGLPVGADAPPVALALRASGAVSVRRQGVAGTLDLLLDAEAAARWLARHPAPARVPAPLQPLRGAIASARVRVEASVGEAEIDIATLQSLVVGDVLLLDGRVDRPVRLGVIGRPGTRGAHLGSVDGHRALQLAAGAESTDLPVARTSP